MSKDSDILSIWHSDLFWKLAKGGAFLAILYLLSYDETRNYYLPVSAKDGNGNVCPDTDMSGEKSEIFAYLLKMIGMNADDYESRTRQFYSEMSFSHPNKETTEARKRMDKCLSVFTSPTDGCWETIKAKGTQYMIVKVESLSHVRSAAGNEDDEGFGISNADYMGDSVGLNGRFKIFDGIQFCGSAGGNDRLYYLEL